MLMRRSQVFGYLQNTTKVRTLNVLEGVEVKLMTIMDTENAVGSLAGGQQDHTPARPGARQRPRLVAIAAVLAVIAVAAGVVILHQRTAPTQLVGGAIVNGQMQAKDFALTDQFGGQVALSDFNGRPIALTFLYTNCPDVCPLIAANLHEAYKRLGDQAGQVGIVAVTVDPEHDSVDKVRQFSDQRGLTNQWRFLVGTRDQLTLVWRAYGILAQPENPGGRPVAPAAQQEERGLLPQPDIVEHSAPIFLIDKRSAVRAMLPVDATPDTLTTDLRALLAES
jgi:protein SCO1/2